MASVASAAVEEMMTENAALQSQVAALQEELATAKAAMTDEEPEAMEEETVEEPEAMEDEETKPEARRRGVRPVAKAKTSAPSASVRWEKAVEECLPKCRGDKMRAVAMASKSNPGLREAFVAEVNAAR